ncbi:MAG: UbiA family prenyltransferase [Deltaproteobacteria bacterium]|nr:UbiA family prenyltransferase [Deltaproteobacteria bacterium]
MDTSPRQEAALEGKQGGRSAGLGGVLSLLRPHQWAKNVLVAVPLVTSHQFSSATAITTLVAAVSFSLAASAGYVINDLADREFDRRHPQKARRPLASGLVSVGAAVALAAGLAIGGGALSVVLLPASFPWALLLYVLLSLSYSAVFK